MSLPIAIQSVVFYVLACTPCAQVRHRHKAKITAKSERKEKARVVAEQPHLYHHPDPFATNPFWDEEIRLGPALRKGKNGKYIKEHGSKEMGSKEMGSKEMQSKELGGSTTAPESVLRQSTNHERMSTTTQERASTATREAGPATPTTHPNLDSSPTVVQEDTASAVLSNTMSVSTADDWNLKRYQREDEELWGHELSRTGQKLMDAIKQAGTTAGRFMESKLGIEKSVTEEDRHNFYFAPKNPPVNDYHPPVVRSKPAHVDDLRWMLQPPPPAKVMEGKVPVSRTASTMSVGSRRTVGGTSEGMSMGRRVGERALEAKLRNGEFPHDERPNSANSPRKTRPRRGTASSTQTRGRRTGSYSTTDSDESSEEMYRRVSRRQSRRAAYARHMESEDSEDEYISMSIESLSTGIVPTHLAQKPRLPTIPSSGSTAKEQKPRASSAGPASTRPLEDVTNLPSTPVDTISTPAEADKIPSEAILATSVDSGVGLHLR